MAFQLKSLRDTWVEVRMNKSVPPTSLQEALDLVQKLREEMARHEFQLEQVQKYLLSQHELQQQLVPTWSPVQNCEKEDASGTLTQKILKLDILDTKPQDTASRLRATWLGKLYIHHLKQYAIARVAIKWIWRNGYPIYANHIAAHITNRKAKRWYPLTKLSTYVKENGLQAHKLAEESPIDVSVPKVFPESDKDYLGISNERSIFPEIYVAAVNDGIVYGGTNLVMVKGEVVCHDLYDFDSDFTSEELHGRTLIDPKFGRIRWLQHDKQPVRIPVAAVFVDACASNYAHWLTEVMSRMALFCADDRFKHIPIIINDGLHPNILESLQVVAGPEREIITLPVGRALHADELYLTSVAGYVPFDRRTKKQNGHSHGIFSPPAFEHLRNVKQHVAGKFADIGWPDKIYLRRNSGARKVTNAIEIEKLLVANGFQVIEPEKLTFTQQIQLFNHAKQIIAPTGASLANGIFCKPQTKVAVLMGKHEDMIYRYWFNMLDPLQVRVTYVLGNIVKEKDLGIHGDFYVNPDDVRDLLEVWQ